jgi:glycolate oxidase FAD binding subunit
VRDLIQQSAETIREAAARAQPLRIRGGGTKDFYGGELRGEILDVRPYAGIVDYEPTELVITARAGTPLIEIEEVMRERGQMLAFEPPHFDRFPSSPSLLVPESLQPHIGAAAGGISPLHPNSLHSRISANAGRTSPLPPGEGSGVREGEGSQVRERSPREPTRKATLGGCIAAGLSGPRRPYAGSARDLVLGVRLLDGRGAELRFGGQVMKNVAGYDVSRLMVGSLGTLAVLLEISVKALPLPPAEATLRFERTQEEAIALMNAWAGKALPISATCHLEGALYVRLSGAHAGVRAARQKLGGEEVHDAAEFWRAVREHELELFAARAPLWRISLKSTSPPLALPGAQLLEWNGALRWIATDADHETVRSAAARGGGHATLFRGGDRHAGVFHPLPDALQRLHERLQRSFDPAGILNPGRLYPQW